MVDEGSERDVGHKAGDGGSSSHTGFEGDDLNRLFSTAEHPATRGVMASGEAGKASMVLLPGGEIVASYIRGYNLARNPPVGERTEIVRSVDGGKTWSEPVRATNSDDNDREGYLVALPDGTLLLCFMKVMAQIEPKRPWQGPYVCRSRDGGRTWSEPWLVDVSEICPEGPYGAGDRGHIVLPDGTLLLFVGIYEQPRRPTNYVFISHDGGETFPEHHLVTDMSGDSSWSRLPSGRILGFLRLNGADFPHRGAHPELQYGGEAVHFMGLTASDDDGRTWSEPKPVTEHNEIPGHILALSDGRLLTTFGVRHYPLSIQAMISTDGGETWPNEARLLLAWHGARMVNWNGRARHTMGHPYSIELADGQILTTYYCLADQFDPASCQVETLLWRPPVER
jgi:hypothetical protein